MRVYLFLDISVYQSPSQCTIIVADFKLCSPQKSTLLLMYAWMYEYNNYNHMYICMRTTTQMAGCHYNEGQNHLEQDSFRQITTDATSFNTWTMPKWSEVKIFVCTFVCMYVYMYVCMCTYTCMYACMYVYLCTRMYICKCVCMHKSMYTFPHLYVCVYIYIHIYI